MLPFKQSECTTRWVSARGFETEKRLLGTGTLGHAERAAHRDWPRRACDSSLVAPISSEVCANISANVKGEEIDYP